MKKVIIILSLLALVASSCATKKRYTREITRVYFLDQYGRELKEILSGMPIRICIESRKTDKLMTNYDKSKKRTVNIQVKAPNDRKFKGGTETLNFEIKLDRKGKANQLVIIEYEPELKE